MPNRTRKPRASGAELRGRRRAIDVARRLGSAVREERTRQGLRQWEVAEAAGVSQSWVSLMERGRGSGASLETWAAVAAAVKEQLVGYLEHAAGASTPRDHVHLKGQDLVIRTAGTGGWRPTPEAPVDPMARRSRSVDVLLQRGRGTEIAVVEVWDTFDDVGDAMRSLDGKVATARRLASSLAARAQGLRVVRGTRRNHALITELSGLFAAKFPARAGDWLRALTDPQVAMPAEPGLLWTDVRGTRLVASRLGSPPRA